MNAPADLAATPEARGQRLRAIRDALRLSRRALEDKYGISAPTLQNWEEARNNGLTEKGAKRILKAFLAEGVTCSLEWLFYGIGEEPRFPDVAVKIFAQKNVLSEETIIAQELRLFHQLNPEAVDTVIADDGLAPALLPGDRVAGKRYFDKDMEKAIGQICIVQTMAGKVLVRLIKSGKDVELYNLECTNPQTVVVQPLLADIQLFSAAPVLWIRKPSSR